MNNKIKNIFLAGISLLFIISLASCAKKINFQASSVVPAARGTVKITKDNNSNYAIKIQLLNLAEPNRLQPAKNVYVVWMEGDNSGVKNIGQIKTDINFLAKKLKASFESVSPVKPNKIFITAEDDATVTYPVGQMVLTTANL